MKTVSLWQPWASAIAVGLKRIETRGWDTNYRGRIAIHAARLNSLALRSCWEIRVTSHEDPALDYMPGAAAAFAAKGIRGYDDLPLGAVVATCDLIDCQPTELLTREIVAPGGMEWKWGDYRPRNDGPKENGKRRWGWLLADVVPLAKPVPFIGRQGFFDVPDELLRAAA